MKKIISIFIILNIFALVFSQSHNSSQSHQARINTITSFMPNDSTEFSYISAGDDGFLIKWDSDNEGEHYQVSDVGIKMAVCAPNKKQIAIYESDGGSVNKVTVWDWTTLTKKYQKKLKDSVTTLSYSAKGTYLIIGTATVDGSIFVRTADWSTVEKVKENTSIVNFIETSDTEKTAVMYSPAGTLSYYNIQTGKTKAKFQCVQGLTNVVLFSNELFLAGIKDSTIYIIQATTGKTLSTIPAQSPIILNSPNDDNLYYIEYDGKTTYSLKMIENMDNKSVSNPRIIKSYRGPRGDASIRLGKKINSNIILGNANGSIYRTTSISSTDTENLTEITRDIYTKINDAEPHEDDFLFLTNNAIFKSSYDTGVVDKIASTSGETSFISYGNDLILFSKETRNPVKFLNMSTKTYETLFTPKNSLQSVEVYGDKILEIEASSTVNIYDMQTKTFKEIFSGMGIQDAVLCDDGNVYIAKSSSTSPASPLISVNPKTLETVPLKVPGQVTYGLSTNGKMVYGINLQSDDNTSVTYVFGFNTATKTVQNILKFSEEDPEAFTYLFDDYLYTNIGKNKVYSYKLSQKKRFAYDRTASMPKKICRNNKRVVILNDNGSISWAGSDSQKLLADWYLTKDGEWFEF